MVEPVGITLASVSLFFQIFDVCDRLYHGYKLTRRFGEDFQILQQALETQWARLDTTLRRRRVRGDEIDVNSPDHYVTGVIKRHLESMRTYFGRCNKLMEWYDGEKHHGPYSESPSTVSLPSATAQTRSPRTSNSTLVDRQESPRPAGRKLLAIFKLRKSSHSPSPVRSSSTSRTRRGDVPGLEAPEMAGVGQDVAQERAEVADSVSYWRKVAWVHEDREALKELIGDIRDANNDLGSLIDSIAIETSQTTLPRFPRVESMWPMVRRVERDLHALHHDLRHVNNATNGHGPYHLTIQLFEDHDDNKSDFEKLLDGQLRLNDNSHVFNIQRHASEQMQDERSELFVIETAEYDEAVASRLPRLHRLQALDSPQGVDFASAPGVECWGYLSAPDPIEIASVVFRSTDASWSSKITLRNVLEGGIYRTKITPIQTVQLARLILCTHLYLERVLRDFPKLRPEHYRYYQTPEEDKEWDSDSPLVLSPWLAIPFGRRLPAPKMGARRGVPQAQSNAMIEIGLVLYQIGTGEPVQYESGDQALKNAKDGALQTLDKLDKRVSSIYAEMVQEFLEFRRPAAYLLSPADDQQEREHIKRAISALHSLEQSTTNTVTGRIPLIELQPAVVAENDA